jgi:hypothetical protein
VATIRDTEARAAALPSVHRRRGHQAIGQDHADGTARRRHRRAEQAHRLGEQPGVLLRHLRGDVASALDDAILTQRLRGDRGRLDRHMRLGELLEVDAVGPDRAHSTACTVIAEDDRPPHPREPAHRVAQPVIKRVPARGPV